MVSYAEKKERLIGSIIGSEQGCMDTYAYQQFYYEIRYKQLNEYTLEEIRDWCNDDDPDREDL